MNRPRWLDPEPIGTSSEEALQTDVMRFMAILGLCLTAIFALVQSMPLTPADPRPEILSPGQLRQEVEALQADAATLRAESARLQHLAARARTQAQTAADRGAVLRRQAEAGAEELARIGRAVDQRRQALQRLEEELLARGGTLSELSREIDRERRALTRLRGETKSARAAIAAAQIEANAEPETPSPPEPSVAAPAKEGFSLRFGSDEALMRLVRDGRVSLFALAPARAWRLELESERPHFTPAQAPRRFHEMTPESVPGALVRALQRDPGIQRRERVTWAVELPGDIAGAIRQATSGRLGGTLLIGDDGRVRVEDPGP
jgi:hypothetical protein